LVESVRRDDVLIVCAAKEIQQERANGKGGSDG
jgi:hypothetical protein